MKLHIDQPGTHTTVQDLGRPGHRAAGVPMGGAVDQLALRIANMLVGNPPATAAMECALVGPTFHASRDTRIAICGAAVRETPMWQPIALRRGQRLAIGPIGAGRGGFSYIAVAGGIDVPQVLGSRSTDSRVGWGGMHGRPLRHGDTLPVGQPHRPRGDAGGWSVNPARLYRSMDEPIRFIRGGQFAQFEPGWLNSPAAVSPQSDRMGIRLEGVRLRRTATGELPSATVTPGTIQAPPDGQLIILLADGQTIGGYPVVGQVITADLPSLAQRRPGEAVRFAEATIEEAYDALREQDRAMNLIRHAIAGKLEAPAVVFKRYVPGRPAASKP